jgi:hypothetical protein
MKVSRNQKCIYWAPIDVNQFGETQYADPIELDCRWEDTQKLFTDKEGKEQISSSIVYPITSVKLDGYLYLGTLNDLNSVEENDPIGMTNAGRIKNFSTSVGVDGTSKVYKAWL